MKRRSTAIWNGSGKEGSGTLSSTSGVLADTPYSFAARFVSEDGKAGTNPEELIAAAHTGCFTMALSFQLGGAGFTADELTTEAVVTVENPDGSGFKILKIELNLKGKVPGIDKDKFMELANNAKKGCPVSQALASVDISLNAELL
jgi:osmotically inducible protein OsmC